MEKLLKSFLACAVFAAGLMAVTGESFDCGSYNPMICTADAIMFCLTNGTLITGRCHAMRAVCVEKKTMDSTFAACGRHDNSKIDCERYRQNPLLCTKDLIPFCLTNGTVVRGSCLATQAVCKENQQVDDDFSACNKAGAAPTSNDKQSSNNDNSAGALLLGTQVHTTVSCTWKWKVQMKRQGKHVGSFLVAVHCVCCCCLLTVFTVTFFIHFFCAKVCQSRCIIMAPSVNTSIPLTSEPPQQQTQGDSGGDTNAAAIAAGVTVPIIIILLTAGIVYWYYRKKYPVRMIVGRDFAKFSNPAYSRSRNQQHTLVRDDADTFFQQTQPSGLVTLCFGENDEEAKVGYVNTGFQYDSHDADEEEVENRFRQQKAYLFKKHDDQDEVDHGGRKPDKDGKKKTKSEGNGEIQRNQGHDNAAFSGDSDVEGGKTGETATKKDETDAESTSSDVSGASKTEDKTGTPESEVEQHADPSSTEMGPELQGGMTVRDFLQLAKEKRALSDVQRTRADSLTTFEFDIKKSARRRAQSLGDIFSSNLQASPPMTWEQLTLKCVDIPHINNSVGVQADSNAVHGTYENLAGASGDGKTTDDVCEMTERELYTDVNVSEEEEEERMAPKSNMEDSYVMVDETPNGSKESLAHPKDDTDHPERVRTDSSTSDSSYEKVFTGQNSDNLQSASHGVHSESTSQHDEGPECSLSQETSMLVISSHSAACQEEDDLAMERVVQPSALVATGDSESLESSPHNAECSEVTVSLEDMRVTKDGVNTPASPSVPVPGNVGSAMDDSGTLSLETAEGFPLHKQSPDAIPADAENGSPSSSLVMLDRYDGEDLDTKDDDSDIGSFKTGAPSYSNQLSTEDEDFDKVHLEQEDARVWDQQPSTGLSTQTQPGVHVLQSLTYSDRSSLSSNDGDDSVKRFTAAGQHQDPPQLGVAETRTPYATSEDAEETKQSPAAAGGDPVPGSDPEAGSPPQSSHRGGLNTLPGRPDLKRSSESEVEDVELTDEDIEQALASDDSSENLQGPQPPQTNPGRAPVKIQLTDKFVFRDDDDDDDDDVDV
ncbi:hypothetical protein ACOMHN_062360 [Nucella lapillus]